MEWDESSIVPKKQAHRGSIQNQATRTAKLGLISMEDHLVRHEFPATHRRAMPCNFCRLWCLYTQVGASDEAEMPEGLRTGSIFTEIAVGERGSKMRYLRYLALLGVLMLPAVYSQAQVAVGVRIGGGYGYVGSAPACAYGYYSYYPYACAPYGYYGPQWFVGGVFIGAGPWYHGYYGRGGYGYYGRGGYGYYGRGGYGYYGRGYYRPGAYGYRGGVGYGGGYARGSGFHGGGGGGFHGGGGRR